MEIEKNKKVGKGTIEELNKKGLTRVGRTTGPDIVDTKNLAKTITGSEFTEKIQKLIAERALKRAANVGLKSIPVIGGLAAGLATGDANAAIPLLGEADSLGPSPDSLEATVEDPSASGDMRRKAIEELLRKNDDRL